MFSIFKCCCNPHDSLASPGEPDAAVDQNPLGTLGNRSIATHPPAQPRTSASSIPLQLPGQAQRHVVSESANSRAPQALVSELRDAIRRSSKSDVTGQEIVDSLVQRIGTSLSRPDLPIAEMRNLAYPLIKNALADLAEESIDHVRTFIGELDPETAEDLLQAMSRQDGKPGRDVDDELSPSLADTNSSDENNNNALRKKSAVERGILAFSEETSSSRTSSFSGRRDSFDEDREDHA